MISPELSDDSALLLMGDSMRHFLGADVQVLRHVMKKVGSGMRAWHGLMYLFPDEMHNDNGQIAASVFLESRSGEQREGSYWRALKAVLDAVGRVCATNSQLQECLLSVGNCNNSNPMNDKSRKSDFSPEADRRFVDCRCQACDSLPHGWGVAEVRMGLGTPRGKQCGTRGISVGDRPPLSVPLFWSWASSPLVSRD